MKISLRIILTITCLVSCLSFSCTSLNASKNISEISECVKKYIEFSSKGEFDELERLIDVKSQNQTSHDFSQSNSPTIEVRQENLEEIDREWIGKEFPEFVFENKFTIYKLLEEKLDVNHAKVTIIFQNEDGIVPLAWTFLLIHEDRKENWKIYKILTNGQYKS